MNIRTYNLTDNVIVYDSGAIEALPFYNPILRDAELFLESIRKQDFQCRLHLDYPSARGAFQYQPDKNIGVIVLQEILDPRFLFYAAFHELCHYNMENHKVYKDSQNGVRISSYEEVFAEMFAFWRLSKVVEDYQDDLYKYIRQLVDSYRKSQEAECRSLIGQLSVSGIRSLPMLDLQHQPIYICCDAIAFYLLPYFESHPELWRVLPHVQDVNPLASWREFLDHLRATADDSYRDSLEKMIKFLLP